MTEANREILFVWAVTGGLTCCCLVVCCILNIICFFDVFRPIIFRNTEYFESFDQNYLLSMSLPITSPRPPPPKYGNDRGTILYQPPPAYTVWRTS